MNLAVNARDAMPDGGRLTIETSNVDLDESMRRPARRSSPARYVHARRLATPGSGMDAATQARIFEPFFTTKELGEGTGLGLSTVYGIVQQSGGYIWVYSEVGVGTTFKIYLPRVVAKAPRPRRRTRVPPCGSSETVLLVEDEESLRELLREALEGSGYRVLVAARRSRSFPDGRGARRAHPARL